MSSIKSAHLSPTSASKISHSAKTDAEPSTKVAKADVSSWTAEKVVTTALSAVLIPAGAVGFGLAASASNFGPVVIGLVALVQGGAGYAISAGIGSLFRQE